MKGGSRTLIPRRLALLAGLAVALGLCGFQQRAPLERRPALDPLPSSWLTAETLPVWPEGPPGGGFAPQPVPADFPEVFFRNVETPTLHVFQPERPNGRAVLLVPGGAYTFIVGTHEGAETASALAERGYAVFVLIHRLPAEGWAPRQDVPLQDAQRAMRTIRSNAERYGIDPDRVAALGYSAGGHLVATLATDFDQAVSAPRDAVDRLSARPAAVGLIYPVIEVSPPLENAQSTLSLLGPAPDPALVLRRSPARHVTASTSPTFLVHALDDTAVPPENSLGFFAALREADVPVELHLYEEGGHGFGLGPSNASAGSWLNAFDAWLGRTLDAAPIASEHPGPGPNP